MQRPEKTRATVWATCYVINFSGETISLCHLVRDKQQINVGMKNTIMTGQQIKTKEG
jgi:hypothetical protein